MRLTRTRATAAIFAAAVATVLGVAANSSGKPKPLAQRFTIYSATVGNRDAPWVVVATGPIRGIGLVAPGAARGNALRVTLTLPRGKVFLSARGNFGWKPDLATCTAVRESVRGTYRITGGTGEYRGAAGTGTLREQGAGIGVRSSSGTCLQRFKVNYVTVLLSGRASVRSS